MKVLEVYDGNKEEIICDGVNVFKQMERFFDKHPDTYRKNYDRNIKDLTIYRVDEMYEEFDYGNYDFLANNILFDSFWALPHELVHMSSNDIENGNWAFLGKFRQNERALIEGTTEYLATQIMDRDNPTAYYFEVFSVSMILSARDILLPFFTADADKFIDLFPNKKDIYSLMYSLNYYSTMWSQCENPEEVSKVISAIKDTIDSLINIELSCETNLEQLKIYREKFMDLLGDKNIKNTLMYVYPDYKNYAYNEIKKRIKIRRGFI